MTTTKTTPAQVRAEIKRRGLKGLELVKTEGSWYILGDATDDWSDHCLYTPAFFSKPASHWVNLIVGMSEHKN